LSSASAQEWLKEEKESRPVRAQLLRLHPNTGSGEEKGRRVMVIAMTKVFDGGACDRVTARTMKEGEVGNA
jgi:hypothetical protein